jgi:hypothetical protein
VAPEAKEAARQQVTDAVKVGGFGAREVFIRVNAVDTSWHADDLAAAARRPRDSDSEGLERRHFCRCLRIVMSVAARLVI